MLRHLFILMLLISGSANADQPSYSRPPAPRMVRTYDGAVVEVQYRDIGEGRYTVLTPFKFRECWGNPKFRPDVPYGTPLRNDLIIEEIQRGFCANYNADEFGMNYRQYWEENRRREWSPAEKGSGAGMTPREQNEWCVQVRDAYIENIVQPMHNHLVMMNDTVVERVDGRVQNGYIANKQAWRDIDNLQVNTNLMVEQLERHASTPNECVHVIRKTHNILVRMMSKYPGYVPPELP